MWGFITCMNDILIPYLKKVFELSHAQAMTVQLSFFGAYFVGSLIYFLISAASGDPINKIGYKNGIILGLLTSAVGTALFFPAAELVSFGFFLAALFVLGIGFTLLQIAANPYVAILGQERTASSRLNLSQGFNSLGTTLAPLIGGYLVFRYFVGPEITGADSVKIPYLIFCATFVVLAFVFYFIPLPAFTNKDEIKGRGGAIQYRHLVLGMIAIFMYVGGEVSIGSIMIGFLGLSEIAGLTEADASIYVAFYWGGLMIGRFIGAISLSEMKLELKIPIMLAVAAAAFLVIGLFSGWDHASIYSIFLGVSLVGFFIGKSMPARTLFVFSLIIITLLTIAMASTGQTAMWAIIGVGIFNSIMWSNIFTLAISGLGKYTSQGSSLLVMAIVGGALLPFAQGALADQIGIHYSYIIPLLAYFYIAFYGLVGYKPVLTTNK
ncbi:MAG: sugar MFS transporter [Bacteroidetes bacterium]|nr:sugar MFS transporter [Bacteroidota bacterium]MBU1720401.1 sugar MFS transporter [Bacteroidota bacterium]